MLSKAGKPVERRFFENNNWQMTPVNEMTSMTLMTSMTATTFTFAAKVELAPFIHPPNLP
jgi:hypothetical protein